jgi:hypothetical protein
MKFTLHKITRRTFFYNVIERLTGLIGPRNPQFKQLPSFQHLCDKDIRSHTNIDPDYSFRNQLYWIPRFYLHKDLSAEFLFQLKKFKYLNNWTNSDQLALTQLILTEAIRDTTYELAYNFEVKPSVLCPFHGTIDILLYNNIKEENYLPVVPIIFPSRERPFLNHEIYQRYNISQLVGICHALLTDFKARNLEIDQIKAFHTNGNEWCLFEVHEKYVKRTRFFRSSKTKPDKIMAQIYEDITHVESIIGLIRYAMGK